jgi:hypothetical protein
MLRLVRPRELQEIEGADEVGADVGARIFQAVANACLRREMNNNFGFRFRDNRREPRLVFEHGNMRGETV